MDKARYVCGCLHRISLIACAESLRNIDGQPERVRGARLLRKRVALLTARRSVYDNRGGSQASGGYPSDFATESTQMQRGGGSYQGEAMQMGGYPSGAGGSDMGYSTSGYSQNGGGGGGGYAEDPNMRALW